MGFNTVQYNIYDIQENIRMANQSINIDSSTLLTKSTISDLELNFSKLPTVTVKTEYEYKIEGEDGVSRGRPGVENDTVNQPIKSISFSNVPYNQKVDIEVEAFFEDCGVLNGQSVDMKIVYTDFYSAKEYLGGDSNENLKNNSKILWWTAYGEQTNQNVDNEWYQRGFENINMKIYFYINNSEMLPLETVYCSFYGIDGENGTPIEGVSSNNSAKVYLYKNSTISYLENALHGKEKYTDIYAGTSLSNGYSKTSAVSFLFKNVNYINTNIHCLNSRTHSGYHVNFIPLEQNYEGIGAKEVSVTEATAGEELSYTISYQMPDSTDNLLKLSTLKFYDELNENLVYKNLCVYDENENNITSAAGTSKFENNALEYNFNTEYLNSINLYGQNYKFVITVQVSDNPTVNTISNTATIDANGNKTNTNSATLDLISYVIVRHFDEYGNELEDPVKMKGKLFEEYNTEAGGYMYYEITELPENTTGVFLPEVQEVTYTYIKTVTDYEVYKAWIDDTPTMGISDEDVVTRPDSIKLKLSSNIDDEVEIVEMTGNTQTAANPYGVMTLDTEEITDDGVWYYKFENLPRFDENGEEIIYSVTEYDVPEGYHMSSCVNDPEYGVATIANVRMTSIIINKYDAYTGDPLEGAVFSVEQIYEDKAYEVGDYTTNSAGMAIVSYINNGTYRIREIKAPTGYSLDDEEYEVEVTSAEFEYLIDVPNKPIINLPEAGGNGNTMLFAIGLSSIIVSIIIIKRNGKRKYKLKHRY